MKTAVFWYVPSNRSKFRKYIAKIDAKISSETSVIRYRITKYTDRNIQSHRHVNLISRTTALVLLCFDLNTHPTYYVTMI
jgi:hypothetical protein